jgi:hypothetical protein
LVVEFLKSAEQGTHAFNESSKGVKSSTVDSLWIINFIQKEFDKRKVEQPTFSQAVEVKFGGYSGTVSSSSSSIGGDLQKRIEYATLEMDPGLVMNVGYSLPLGRSYSTADHCYEVVFQQLKFRAKSPVSTTEFSSSVIGVNGLYRLTFPMSNLSKMRIGGGPSLIYRLPFQQTTYTSFNLNTDAVIENLSNFDIGLVGQAQLEFSLSRTIAFLLDYRFNLGMISLDGSVGPSYKVNTSALSAGVRLPVR